MPNYSPDDDGNERKSTLSFSPPADSLAENGAKLIAIFPGFFYIDICGIS
jgi:hypothetical protein